MGLSAPSANKVRGASPLTAALRLPSILGFSTPPPASWRSLPPHGCASLPSILGFSTPSTKQSWRSLPPHGCASLALNIMGLSAPSANKVRGASPLSLASLA